MAKPGTLQPCRVLRGFFVLRPCGTDTGDVCPVCHRPVCAEHQRTVAGRVLCIECAVREHDPVDHSRDDRSTLDTFYYAYGTGSFGSSSSSSSDAGFSGGGGAFGGGGAGGSWDDAAGVYAYRDTFYSGGEGQGLAAFGAADFAAFDQGGAGSSFDETDDGGFFDS